MLKKQSYWNKNSKLILLLVLSLFLFSGCVQIPAILLGGTVAGAGVSLWIVIIVLALFAIFNPKVFPIVLGIGVFFFVIATTSFTTESTVWIGIILLILWIIFKKK